ncbi:MAG: M48 family metallopeptidase [Spirochaetales bacterium]|nr:M48 family metallopeptidase [Spirochaetales bacterium]MCF7937769.1 M48 family metallopeptidase [Spirochaetales bacterium]
MAHRTSNLRAGNLEYTLTLRKGQKHINLRIGRSGELLVSAPTGTPVTRIESFLRQKAAWITRHQQRIHSVISDFHPERRVVYRGQVYEIRIHQRPGKSSFRLEKESGILSLGNDGKAPGKAIEGWLRRTAGKEIGAAAREWASAMGIHYKKLYLRNQKNRWGSSSGLGNISVNWRAVMLPVELMEYIVVHELAHQRRQDHSPIFWAEVERWVPNHAGLRRNLRQWSGLLSLFRE